MSEQMIPHIEGDDEPAGKKTRVEGRIFSAQVDSVSLEEKARLDEECKMEKDYEVRNLAQGFLEGYVGNYDLKDVHLLWSSSIPGTASGQFDNVWFSVAMTGRVGDRWVVIQYSGTNRELGRDKPKVTEWLVPAGRNVETDIKINTLQNVCEEIDFPDYIADLEVAAIRHKAARQKAEREDLATYMTPQSLPGSQLEPSLDFNSDSQVVADAEVGGDVGLGI